MTENKEEENHQETVYQTFSNFLESTPPNQTIHISDLVLRRMSATRVVFLLNTINIQLHCTHVSCNGTRFFRCVDTDKYLKIDEEKDLFVKYTCSNCRQTKKLFSLRVILDNHVPEGGICYKLGEMPTFGPPIPSKLLKLFSSDREIFLKGRRCENQGLGIGAFIYYRRVVENHKNRILQEIIKVSKKLSLSQEKIEILESAVKETQFSKALKMAKDAIPESLLINGHSPITLLHSALSEGVHGHTDEECLQLASSIRIVLGELSERLSQALKDEAELTKALSTLMHRKKDPEKPIP